MTTKSFLEEQFCALNKGSMFRVSEGKHGLVVNDFLTIHVNEDEDFVLEYEQGTDIYVELVEKDEVIAKIVDVVGQRILAGAESKPKKGHKTLIQSF